MKSKIKQKWQEGFTLIELLVVISIITLLSSVVLASMAEARMRAQKTALEQAILSVRTALEIYRTNEGKYPFENEGGMYDIITVNNAGITYANNGSGPDPSLTQELPFITELMDKKALPAGFKMYSGGLGDVDFVYEILAEGDFPYYLCAGGANKAFFWIILSDFSINLNLPKMATLTYDDGDGIAEPEEFVERTGDYCLPIE